MEPKKGPIKIEKCVKQKKKKKIPPKKFFVDCAKKKINVRPPLQKKILDLYKKIIEKLKKSYLSSAALSI